MTTVRAAAGSVRGLLAVATVAGAAAAASVWWPVVRAYQTGPVGGSAAAAERQRSVPADSVLEIIGRTRLATRLYDSGAEAVRVADALQRGWLVRPAGDSLAVPAHFEHRVIVLGPIGVHLFTASLGIPHAWLTAYEATGDTTYRHAARAWIARWAAFERRTLVPRGLQWNDHALASRAAVLIKYWRHTRGDSDSAHARLVLDAVARTAALLAKPELFTVATNHGIMQNLALLKLAIAFPELPAAETWRTTAFARLLIQLPFLVSAEGVFLEHSTGYQGFDLLLLREVREALSMLGTTVPDWVEERYLRARDVLCLLVRPDGSLATVGDTERHGTSAVTLRDLGLSAATCNGVRAHMPRRVFPVAGYAVWWGQPASRAPSQTVVAWSRFPGHAHLHDEDLSLHLWGERRSWLTSAGYWPYGDPFGDAARSWGTSNAPYYAPAAATRTAEVTALGWAESGPLAFIDLRRVLQDGREWRRQVASLDAVSLIVDWHQASATGEARTVWLFEPGVELQLDSAPAPGVVRAQAAGGTGQLTLGFAGAPSHLGTVDPDRRKPLAWVESNGAPAPTAAVERSGRDGGAWLTAIAPDVRVTSFAAPAAERWSADLVAGGRGIRAWRDGERICYRVAGPDRCADMVRDSTIAVQRDAIRSAWHRAVTLFPLLRLHVPERRTATLLMAGIWGVQIVGLLLAAWVWQGVLARPLHRRVRFGVAMVVAVSWWLLANWVHGYYLA